MIKSFTSATGANDGQTGYEIKLSGNHTTLLPNGKVKQLTDICDKLVGKYPKTFMFTGWHPQCRCYVVPITIRDAELTRQLEKDGEVNTDAKQITDVPDNMHQWLDDNQQRIDNAKQLPPFIEDNKQLIEPQKEPEPKKPTPQEIADKRHAERTAEQVADIKARWKEHEEQVRREEIKRIAEERHAKRTPEQAQAIKDAWDIHNSKLKDTIKVLQAQKAKIGYNAVKPLQNPLTEKEIIDKVGGGDLTKGSCSSVALSYIGNKYGLDVRDFRGGESRKFFADGDNIQRFAKELGGTIMKRNDIKTAIKMLNGIAENKEYYYVIGGHAAVVRKVNNNIQFLELQSADPSWPNGWKRLSDYTLSWRFGAEKKPLCRQC